MKEAIQVVKEAGKKTLEIYNRKYDVETKSDDSPLTEADLASHEILEKGLSELGYPVLSEESDSEVSTDTFWVIDPLDGTMDFMQKTDEFSIMVALVKDKRPVLGIVYAPALGKLYYAEEGKGCYMIEGDSEPVQLKVDSRELPDYRMIISRNHFRQEDQDIALRLGIEEFRKMGSVGVKYARIAESKGELCIYTTGALGIWDCAAPHIILKEAGGVVFDVEGNEPAYDSGILKMKKGFIGTLKENSSEVIRSVQHNRKGAVLWFTGLSGSGKSTVATKVYYHLKKEGYNFEMLDGDEVRENLTADLGFTKNDRDENIKRISFVARLLSRNNVIVIASFISPYRKMRESVRKNVTNFVEVFVNAPLEVCEERDVKGLYKKARAGEIPNFTGISDPYEEPTDADIELKTDKETVNESVDKVLEHISLINGEKR